MKDIKCPAAFFDTLEEMPNPFKNPVNSLEHLIEGAPADALRDYQYASEFIYSYRGSPDTFSTYRREIEHFLHWCWLIANKSVNQILREDVEAYVDFARQPPAAWIGKKNVARFLERNGARVPNKDWRPYVNNGGEYVVSQAAIQSLFSVLSSYFNFLIQENYISANPVSQMRQKSKFLRKQQSQGKIRRLSPLQWEFVIDAADYLAKQDPATHERTLFILHALYAMYLRISELVETPRWQPQMGHFQLDQEGNWWFVTVGKGNKEREISVSDAMLGALKRYRLSRGLPPLPAPGEASPLIHKTRGKGGITSTRQIRGIVQTCFDLATEKMRKEGFMEDAERLSTATVHWLRHTGISDDVKHRPREHVRDDAGHGSSAITDRYIDVERAERHATARHKIIR
ncbi:MAG: tyrosine-type recombinase/integrase [Gammaproteobacteria bacterium]|nr:tyrosine-type recombinase/integrase [Gammaproteobacteria bacterium]MDD9896354.1 tyrosine-type recombinase/integrase [Gammaproteobacteria bacterium]MDD9958167.1 tyrosine-type recombinase/integrase [Gammaproteobacteria bacterium]